MTEDIAEILDEFKTGIMPRVRAAIEAYVAVYPDNFKKRARIDYLKNRMEGLVEKAFRLMDDYDRHIKAGDIDNRLYTGELLLGTIKTINALQGEIIFLRNPGKSSGITDDMIRRAKEYPFEDLHEFKHNVGLCPFHDDKEPSMRLFPVNHVYCFSCTKGWDTIGFIMERNGLPFRLAVKKLI